MLRAFSLILLASCAVVQLLQAASIRRKVLGGVLFVATVLPVADPLYEFAWGHIPPLGRALDRSMARLPMIFATDLQLRGRENEVRRVSVLLEVAVAGGDDRSGESGGQSQRRIECQEPTAADELSALLGGELESRELGLGGATEHLGGNR